MKNMTWSTKRQWQRKRQMATLEKLWNCWHFLQLRTSKHYNHWVASDINWALHMYFVWMTNSRKTLRLDFLKFWKLQLSPPPVPPLLPALWVSTFRIPFRSPTPAESSLLLEKGWKTWYFIFTFGQKLSLRSRNGGRRGCGQLVELCGNWQETWTHKHTVWPKIRIVLGNWALTS